MGKKNLKVGISVGQGRPPGYQWSVWVLNVAFKEAEFLRDEQYEHLVLQFQELARQEDPTHSDVVSVRAITPEEFHELRDKGGVLGKLNVRVFFGVDKDARAIVVLGAIKKENDGPTPRGDMIRMRSRWRKYHSGE